MKSGQPLNGFVGIASVAKESLHVTVKMGNVTVKTINVTVV